MAKLEYFYDFVSPFTYLANAQIPGIVSRTGCQLVARPFFLGGVMKATGNAPPVNVPAKGAYMFGDLGRWARRYGVTIQMPSVFPFNSLKAMRGAVVASREDRERVYRNACFHAIWAEGSDVGSSEGLALIAERAGLDPAAFLAAIERQDVKDELTANTNEAVERGAFGAPTFFVDDAEMFWGNDRLDFVEEALRSADSAGS